MNYTDNEFVKLNRKILTWRWFSDPCTRDVFIYCILKANWKPGCWRNIEYSRGEFITTLPTLSQELGYSVQSIRTALNHLKSTGEIKDRKDYNKRVITVCNYDKYQSKAPTDASTDEKNTQSTDIPTLSESDGLSVNSQFNRRLTGGFDSSDKYYFKTT